MPEEGWPWPSVRALVKARGRVQAGRMNARTEREKRLAAALRDNLRRRKAQSRATDEQDIPVRPERSPEGA